MTLFAVVAGPNVQADPRVGSSEAGGSLVKDQVPDLVQDQTLRKMAKKTKNKEKSARAKAKSKQLIFGTETNLRITYIFADRTS